MEHKCDNMDWLQPVNVMDIYYDVAWKAGGGGYAWPILHCPYCGEKLPAPEEKSRRDQ